MRMVHCRPHIILTFLHGFLILEQYENQCDSISKDLT